MAKTIEPTSAEPEVLAMSATERAINLFQALDVDSDGLLTMEEFIAGYMERSVLQAKQDAQEQRQHKDWLSFRGPLVILDNVADEKPVVAGDEESLLNNKQARHIAGLITKRIEVEVDVQNGDVTFVGIQKSNENRPKSLLVRFQTESLRDSIWEKRREAKKNGLIIEEWLTEHRARLHKKCKELKAAKLIKDVITQDGDIYAILKDEKMTRLLVVSDTDYENVVKITRKTRVDEDNGTGKDDTLNEG